MCTQKACILAGGDRDKGGKCPLTSHRSQGLTLVLEEQDLHSIEGEGLPEAVCHRVLLLLEDLGDLGQQIWSEAAVSMGRLVSLCHHSQHQSTRHRGPGAHA